MTFSNWGWQTALRTARISYLQGSNPVTYSKKKNSNLVIYRRYHLWMFTKWLNYILHLLCYLRPLPSLVEWKQASRWYGFCIIDLFICTHWHFKLSSQKVLSSLPNTCTEFSIFPFQPPQLPLCPTEGVLWLCKLTRQSLENGHEHQKRLPFGISFICVKLANGLHEYRNEKGHHANCAYLKTSAKKALRQTKHLFIKIICRNNKKPTRTRSYTVLCDMFFPFPIKSYSTL